MKLIVLVVVLAIVGCEAKKKISFQNGQLDIEALKPENKQLGCPQNFYTALSGSLASPNFPYSYTSGISCNYRIVVSSSNYNRISLNVNSILLPDDGKILIYDGIDEDSALIYTINSSMNSGAFRLPSVKSATGGAPNIWSASNAMYISFVGGTLINNLINYGFNATYTSYAGITQNYSSSSTGLLTSPNYPFNYPNNYDRVYTIITPNNGTNQLPRLQLRITDFLTENNYDYLRIVDGSWIGGELIASYTGNPTTPIVVNSSSNAISLYFHSDEAVNYRGFSLFWLTI
uniref:CUB domain-containing protein n=1 Tax=Acrobeloides nanus TaxID=290746 RepID=A0A914EEJ5_9BILA